MLGNLLQYKCFLSPERREEWGEVAVILKYKMARDREIIDRKAIPSLDLKYSGFMGSAAASQLSAFLWVGCMLRTSLHF